MHTNNWYHEKKTDETSMLGTYMLMGSYTYKNGMLLAPDDISPKQYCDKALFFPPIKQSTFREIWQMAVSML